jgi:hypothetical protein
MKIVPTARLMVAAEWRFANYWFAQAGLAVRAHFFSNIPEEWELPLTLGHIF